MDVKCQGMTSLKCLILLIDDILQILSVCVCVGGHFLFELYDFCTRTES